MLIRISLLSAVLFAFTVSSADAQSYQQRGTRRGAIAGAVIGGLVGGNNDHTALGIVAGGALGAVAGNAIGAQKDSRVYQQQYNGGNYGYQPYSYAQPSYVNPHQGHLHQYQYQAPVQGVPVQSYQQNYQPQIQYHQPAQPAYPSQPIYDYSNQLPQQHYAPAPQSVIHPHSVLEAPQPAGISAPQPYPYQSQPQQAYPHGW